MPKTGTKVWLVGASVLVVAVQVVAADFMYPAIPPKIWRRTTTDPPQASESEIPSPPETDSGRQKRLIGIFVLGHDRCVELIQARRFNSTSDRNTCWTTQNALGKIIADAYNHSEQNFDLLRDYARHLSSKSSSTNPQGYTAFRALYEAMIESGHERVDRNIDIMKNLQSWVIYYHKFGAEVKTEADKFCREISNSTIKLGAAKFKFALDGDYDSIRGLADLIYAYSDELFGQVMKQLLRDFGDDEKFQVKLVNKLFTHDNGGQLLVGLLAVYDHQAADSKVRPKFQVYLLGAIEMGLRMPQSSLRPWLRNELERVKEDMRRPSSH